MVIHTRSMRHATSDQEVPDPRNTRSAMRNAQGRAEQASQRKSADTVARAPSTPQTPPQQRPPRRSKRIPSTPTTASPATTNRPARPTRSPLPASQSLPHLLASPHTGVHTTRYLPEAKLAHLTSWLAAQAPTTAQLDPTTPTRQVETRSHALSPIAGREQARKQTRARAAGAAAAAAAGWQWRRQVDDVSIAPVAPAKGVVRNLGAAFQRAEMQEKRPP